MKKRRSFAEKRKLTAMDTRAPIGDEDNMILITSERIDRKIDRQMKVIGGLARDLSATKEGSEEYKKLMAKLEAITDDLGMILTLWGKLLERRAKTRKR